VLPRYLRRTDWVLAGVSKAEMQRREAAEWVSGKLKEPEPGAVSYMMSKGGYINDSVGHWYPHVMFFTPRMSPARWGANLPGSPVMADDHSYAHTNYLLGGGAETGPTARRDRIVNDHRFLSKRWPAG